MHRELQCVPDVWSLVEWSDWLTPQNLHMRYDTVFYLSFVTDQPSVNQDGEEIVDAKVSCNLLSFITLKHKNYLLYSH